MRPDGDGARHRYRVYGEGLAVDVPLRGLPREERAPAAGAGARRSEFHVRRSKGPLPEPGDRVVAWKGPRGDAWLVAHRTATAGYRIEVGGVASFHLGPGGREIRYRRVAALADGALGHLLLNQVLPLALGLGPGRALHASAVDTPGGAALLLGPTGAGKSTLAAGLVADGHPLMADDAAYLVPEGGQVRLVPSHPGIRLEADALRCLRRRLPALASPAGERTPGGKLALDARRLPGGFGREPRPLRVLLVLDGKGTGAAEGLMALLEHALRLATDDRAALAGELELLGRVARRVPMRRVPRRGGPEATRAAVGRWLNARGGAVAGSCGRRSDRKSARQTTAKLDINSRGGRP